MNDWHYIDADRKVNECNVGLGQHVFFAFYKEMLLRDRRGVGRRFKTLSSASKALTA